MLKYILPALAVWMASASPAKAQSVTRTTTGVAVRTEGGMLTLDTYSDRVIHVRFGPAGFGGNYNPAVIAKPRPVDFKVVETPEAIILATAALRVRISRAGGNLTFLTSDGTTLLEERGRDLNGGVSARFGTSMIAYGLGQHQNGMLDYSGSTVHLQQANRDVAVPMLVSPSGFGLLWNNASVTDFDVGQPAKPPLTIHSEQGGGVDYDFIYGPELDDVIGGYRDLTGQAPMMPRWSWGLFQSKERYATQEELLGIAAKYRALDIPLDAVVQDWQYWLPGQWGSHRFDPARYSDPAAMLDTLHREHVHAIVSVWARFDLDTANGAELDKAGALFPKVYGNVYPSGEGRWYDAWNPKGREIYWRQLMRNLGSLGFDGWWLDASEAELGGNWGEMRDVATAAGPGAEVFNAYPLMHTTAVHDGTVRDQLGKRAFLLTRSAYAGQQRNGAVTWSGDTEGNWETFRRQIPAALNFSLSGLPYWSADIGGFFGGDPKDPAYAELFTRWFQFGVFNPMLRVHGTNQGKEIWAFDEATQKVLIDYDRLRYRLLPYIYSASWNVTNHHGTMMRALAFDFREDPAALHIADEYMFGKALLVAPVVQKGAKVRTVYLPGSDAWYDFRTGAQSMGGQVVAASADIATIPVFVPAGSILPLGPVKAYADAPSDEPMEIRVYPGRDGSFDLYDDAGDGYGYVRGERAVVSMRWSDAAHRLEIGPRQGRYPGMAERQVFSVRCGTGTTQAHAVTYDGNAAQVTLSGCK